MDALRYEKGRKLGSGTYGDVFQGFDAYRDCPVAIKLIKKQRGQGIGILSNTIREIAVLRELDHTNIVRLEDVAIDFPARGELSLIFEYLDADLSSHIRKAREACKAHVKVYMHQLLSGLAYCHARHVLHRDIKPANILLDRASNTLKLADFGLTRRQPITTYTHEVFTLWYRPPEILLGAAKYDESVDVWSMGCVFAELAAGKPLFPGDAEIDQIFKIFKVLGTPSPGSEIGQLQHYNIKFPRFARTDLAAATGLPPLGVDLLEKMLDYTPSCRIRASDALRHPYFADVVMPSFVPSPDASPPSKRSRNA